jgi:pimeloyl-ACP methyl ester carboxylesterase
VPSVKVGAIDLSYERSGEGPPLLLIMGMSGTLMHWGEPFVEELRRDFDVIAYDHRGVGRSTRLDGTLSTAGMAADAAGLLAALDVERAHVMGVSMGGMVAQELALADPDRIQTLILGCTYCGGPGSSLGGPGVRERLREAMESGDRARALRTAWEVNLSASGAADDASFARFLEVSSQHSVAVPVILAQLQAVASHDTSARLGAIAAPTFVVHGSEDVMIVPANAGLIADRIPDSRVELLDGVGHMFWWEQPERAAELVREHVWTATTSS